MVEQRDRSRQTAGLDAYSDFWYGVAGTGTKAGVPISEKTAMNYLTVARCVMLISADVARLPLILYRRFPDGSKQRMVDHPLYDILHDDTNNETSSFQWRESGNSHIELWGNHYSEIIRKPMSGEIRELRQIADPGSVVVKRNEAGVIEYRWRDKRGQQTKTRENVFHIPGFGFNGLVGLSVLGMIRESVGLGIANDEFAARYFGQGMNIGGVMDIPHDLGEQKAEYLAALKKEYAGLTKSHGVLVTHNGEKFTQLIMPLKDAQFLEGREFQKAEVAGFYGVPGHKVGIYKQNTNRNNTEQENQGYLDSCLIHRITRYETCISQQLLTKKERLAGLFAEFNVTGLLRADAAGRAEYYNKMFQVAGITPNQIAMKENMNPIGPQGDQHFIMLNMIPLSMAGDLATPKTEQKSQRSIEHRNDKNIVTMFSRIKSSHRKLLKRAAEEVVSKETIAIKRGAKKHFSERGFSDFNNFLDSFYKDHEKYVRLKFDPVFRVYGEAIHREASALLGVEAVLTP
ncbi:MAG: phage portal protein, partial [bacterium]